MPIPSLKQSIASLEISKYWSSKNGNIKPIDVLKSSGKKYWFDCHLCGHEFEIILSTITRGCWCPYCVNQKLCVKNDCVMCFKKSFASHEKQDFWSSKNENIKPRDVFRGSGKKYLFDCHLCGHEFESVLGNISRGAWCGFCANKILCDNIDCKTCYKKSFASHEKNIFWSSKNGNIKPRDVFKSSNKKYLFDCNLCGHKFESVLGNITNGENWCGFCSNRLLCESNDCKMCLDKSFESHTNSKYWSNKNKNIKPRDVFKCSDKKFWFQCSKGHDFKSSLHSISNQNSWCPICKNKTELKLYQKIIQTYTLLQKDVRYEWCKNKRCLPFDFCIPEKKTIIELDGRQHFTQITNWPSPEEQFENDKYKEKCANDNGYSTIRIVQEDVWNDVYDWCKELCEAIEKIKNGNEIVNIYLCKNNEYEKYDIKINENFI